MEITFHSESVKSMHEKVIPRVISIFWVSSHVPVYWAVFQWDQKNKKRIKKEFKVTQDGMRE